MSADTPPWETRQMCGKNWQWVSLFKVQLLISPRPHATMAHFTVSPQSSQIALKSECSGYITPDSVELEIYAGGSDQPLGLITLTSSQIEDHIQKDTHVRKIASLPSIREQTQILTLSFHVAKAEDTQDEDLLVLTESACQSLGSDLDKLGLLCRAGDAFQSRFSSTNSLTDINNAIKMYEAANSLTLQDHKDKINVIKTLAQFHSARFTKMGDSDDIDKAISFQQQILLLLPHDEEANRGRILHSLGGLLMCRSRYTNDEADISETIITLKKAQNLTPTSDSLLPFILRNLGSSFQIRYQKLKNTDDITHSIDVLRTATSLLSEDHPDLPYFLSNLGAPLISRFLIQGNLADVDESASFAQKAADMLAVDHPDRPIMLSNLASSFVHRFRKTKNIVDIDKAISLRRQAITLMHVDHVDMPSILCNLGNAYLRRFEQTGASFDIDEAISIHRDGVQLFPANHVELVGKLFDQRNLLLRRLRRTHQSEDLEEAIAILERAVSLKSLHHSYISDQLQALRMLKGELHTLAKYDDEIREKNLRLDVMLAGDEEIPAIRNELGLLYFLSFCLTGELEDIEASKDNLKSCVNLTLADDAALPTHHDELGSISLRKFRFTGDEVDIEDAFFSCEQSIYFTPKNDEKLCERVDRLVYLFLLPLDTAPSSMRLAITARWKALDEYLASLSAENASVLSERLGRSLLLRFQRLDDMEDANRAITMYNKALYYNVTPIRLAKLGEAYFRRFQRTGAVSDIENAIATQQRAVDQATEDDPFMPRILNPLGISFLHLFKLKGNRLDLHEAIRLQRKAVDLSRSDHLLLSSLGSSLLRLAELSGNLKDLDESISLQQEASIRSRT
ncbi:hypothetical protein BDQ12DRAFT_739658 [Crucibulum laeve]|uniref:TPR-like protein n=1 Tax=Crucibulum laeve TaxID=68775 RepID=A0A5C3LGV3_9AGAR|nr:hypothetical protein BDQ12DRAFT_739658 [Crucibulum laeve]